MTNFLDPESLDALVKYRVERAHKTLAEVNILISNSLYSTAVNRMYYAAYYAAIALLLRDGHNPTTHAGVRSLLGMHYIRTGKISREVGNYFMLLFEHRHRNDYDDFIETGKEEAESLQPMAKCFIDAIDALLS